MKQREPLLHFGTVSAVGTLLLLLVVLLPGWSCKKSDELPDRMVCTIEGELLVWESDKKVEFDPGDPPVICLMEQRYYKPWSSYRVPLHSVTVNAQGRFSMEFELEKEGEYYLEIEGFNQTWYVDNAPSPRVLYQEKQVLDYRLVAFSWVTPRFINSKNFFDDTLIYVHGIGINQGPLPVFVGPTDTIMPWIHTTWGGGQIGQLRHFASCRLIRSGISVDTNIYYFVPPGDTSIVEIRY